LTAIWLAKKSKLPNLCYHSCEFFFFLKLWSAGILHHSAICHVGISPSYIFFYVYWDNHVICPSFYWYALLTSLIFMTWAILISIRINSTSSWWIVSWQSSWIKFSSTLFRICVSVFFRDLVLCFCFCHILFSDFEWAWRFPFLQFFRILLLPEKFGRIQGFSFGGNFFKLWIQTNWSLDWSGEWIFSLHFPLSLSISQHRRRQHIYLAVSLNTGRCLDPANQK
jgi:hypothetical protein